MKKYIILIAMCAIVGGAKAQLKVDAIGNVSINGKADFNKWTEFYSGVDFHYLTTFRGSGVDFICPVAINGMGLSFYGKNGNGDIVYMSEYRIPGMSSYYFDISSWKNNYIRLGSPAFWLSNIWSYDIECQNLYQISDVRLKENIRPCTSLVSKIKSIQSYSYNFTNEYFKDFSAEQKQKVQKTEYGFLAQDLQKVFPELVRKNDSTGMLSINYIGMIPVLTAAINEMQQTAETRDSIVNVLQQEVETLRTALIACCSNGKTQKSMQDFELTNPTDVNAEGLKVFQNTPNPFTVTTIISCYIPESIKKVELCVYDMQGGLIKCLTISERGTTNVQIQAGQLAAGIYTYLLIGDGKTSDAKQMILTK